MRKLVLNRDVDNLGKAGDVVEVKDGYARNYLIPRGYAELWTKGTQRHIDALIERRRKHDIESVEEAVALRNLITEADPVVLVRKASANGRLFGGVSAKLVGEALSKAFSRVIDHRKVDLLETIKTTGEYPIQVRLHQDVVAKTTIVVAAE